MPQGWGNNTFPATLATTTDAASTSVSGGTRAGDPTPSPSAPVPGKKAIVGAVAGGVVGGVVGTLLIGALIFFLRR